MASMKLDLSYLEGRPAANPALDDLMLQNVCSTSLANAAFPMPEVKDVSAGNSRA